MTDWKKVTGTQPDKPEEVDRTSSPSTVYLRKNIEQVTREVEGSDGKMQTVTEWQYDEKEMTVKEYENMALMKSVVEENTSGIVESVTQFQKDAVIDEYTAQLGGSDLMRILVESLKRMYTVKKTLTKEQISERVAKGSISADEYEYITGETFSGGDTE